MYYGMDGQPITYEQFISAIGYVEDKTIARDIVNGFLVSTVWLGSNHNFDGGEPLIFETMIFKEGNWEDLYVDRYATREQALAGHAVALKWLEDNYE